MCCALEDFQDDSAAIAPWAEPLPAVPALDAAPVAETPVAETPVATLPRILTPPAEDTEPVPVDLPWTSTNIAQYDFYWWNSGVEFGFKYIRREQNKI